MNTLPRPELPPVITQPQDARVIRAFGDEIHIHFGAQETGGRYTMFMDFTPPGGGPPPHYHTREDEWFHVLEGRASFFRDGEWNEVPVGTTVFMPKNSLHTFKNIGDKPLQMLITTAPAGIESFFADSEQEFSKAGGPDMQRLLEIGAGNGIYFPQL